MILAYLRLSERLQTAMRAFRRMFALPKEWGRSVGSHKVKPRMSTMKNTKCLCRVMWPEVHGDERATKVYVPCAECFAKPAALQHFAECRCAQDHNSAAFRLCRTVAQCQCCKFQHQRIVGVGENVYKLFGRLASDERTATQGPCR